MAQLIIWYGNIEFPRGTTAALLAALVALGIAALNDWRIVLPLLLAAYFLTSMLLLGVADPRIALVLFIVGVFVCLILLITELQLHSLRNEAHDLTVQLLSQPGTNRSQTSLRLIRYGVLILLFAAGWFAGQLLPVPDLPPYMSAPIYTMALLGIVAVVSTQDAFKVGCGIVLVLLGLGLFVTAFDQTFFVMLSLSGLHLLVAVVTAFMMMRQANKEFVPAR